MERTITQRFGPEEYERVAMLYSQGMSAETIAEFEENDTQKLSLTGNFGADMPVDSHNRGVYLYCDSPLGSAANYTERFGGRHDMAAMLRQQQQSFDALWDIVLLHLDALVGDSADYAALRPFLDTTMRADMWDLMLELTVSDLGADATRNLSLLEDMPDDAEEKLVRALHFLDARGYTTLQEALEETVGELGEDDWNLVVMKALGQAVGRRMGMQDRAMPAAFKALMDLPREQLEEDLERLHTSDERIVRRLAEFRQDVDGMGAAEPSDSLDVATTQAFLFDLDLLDFGGDARDVTLYIPVEPYQTNGAWYDRSLIEADNARSFVEWQYPLASVAPSGDLAQVIYALWAEPAKDYQVERFGAEILDDSALAEQCRWRQMLGPSLRDEWDAFIDGLRPGPDLANTLRRFVFSIEEPINPDEPTKSQSRIAETVTGHLATNVPRDESRN